MVYNWWTNEGGNANEEGVIRNNPFGLGSDGSASNHGTDTYRF